MYVYIMNYDNIIFEYDNVVKTVVDTLFMWMKEIVHNVCSTTI